MIQFLEELKGRGVPPLSPSEKEELDKLRREHTKLLTLKKKDEEEEKKGAESDASSGVSLASIAISF